MRLTPPMQSPGYSGRRRDWGHSIGSSSPPLPEQTKPQVTCLARGAKGDPPDQRQSSGRRQDNAGSARHSQRSFLPLKFLEWALPVLQVARTPAYREAGSGDFRGGIRWPSWLRSGGALPRSHTNSRLLLAWKASGQHPSHQAQTQHSSALTPPSLPADPPPPPPPPAKPGSGSWGPGSGSHRQDMYTQVLAGPEP